VRRTGLARAALYLVYLVLFTLVSLELLTRATGYAESDIYDPIYMPFEGTPDIPYVARPNLKNARGRGMSIVSTDSLGLRSPVSGLRYGPKEGNEYRIAFAGDSGTFGDGVARAEDTFVKVVERTLNTRQTAVAVRTFNYGGSGYNVKVMAATLRHRMLAIDPDLVLMVIIADDFFLGRTPAVDAFGYLADNRLAWLVPVDSRVRKAARGIHLLYPLAFAFGQRNPARRALLDRVLEGKVPDTYRYVREFRDLADQHGVPHLIAFRPPAEPGVTPRLVEQARADRMEVVDLSSIRDEFTWEEYRASRFDGHPSAAVHRRIGEELAEEILRRWLEGASYHPRVR
jgi:hypothetical protein